MSRMTHQFSRVPQVKIPRSKFDRSNRYLATMDAGYLYPIYIDEMVPGDTATVKEHLFGRFNTPIVPFMDNVYLDTQYFFVPLRLLWDNFEKFMGAQANPGDSTDYLVPQMEPAPTGGIINSTLFDYFGLPTEVEGIQVNAWWSRAYNLIWNEWYRDQNIQNSIPVDTDDGPDSYNDYSLMRRNKRHDYFTSCLPFPQKGPEVRLPLGESALVHTNAVPGTGTSSRPSVYVDNVSAFRSLAADASYVNVSTDANIEDRSLYADLTDATASSINEVREAFTIQQFLERDARSGTRYIESVLGHFGVVNPDFRLQRPEYLGGGSVRVNINPVAQTSESTTESPQGSLAAYGVVSSNKGGFTYSATEHGVLIGLASIRADLTYQNGINKMFSRQTRFDYYFPEFAHLGEQAVLNKEIFAQGTTDDDEVFGYIPRFDEMRYKDHIVTSQFRSNYAQSLDIWHLAQDFSVLPTLNGSFIQEQPPIDRVVATPDEPHLKLDCWFQSTWARPMPVYAVPGLARL